MKKFLSLMMTMALLLSALCVGAAAASIDSSGGTSHDVLAKYIEGAQTDAYKVELKWGSMQFTYSAAKEEWNVDDHVWDIVDAGGWKVNGTDANVITITNHSSKSVTAKLGFTSEAGIGGSFSKTNVVVGSAADAGKAVVETVTFTPTGTLTKTKDNAEGFVTVGKITVTLA